jgi:hypothetical protein
VFSKDQHTRSDAIADRRVIAVVLICVVPTAALTGLMNANGSAREALPIRSDARRLRNEKVRATLCQLRPAT